MPEFVCQPFATVEDVLAADCGCDLNSLDDSALLADLIDVASDQLYVLSAGAIYGTCTRTVRPVWQGNCMSPQQLRVVQQLATVPLRGPNTSIVEVVVDGVVLAASEYRLLDGRYLLRVGTKNWPTRNDLELDDTEVGTWSITYSFGRPINEITKRACVQLVCAIIADEPAVSKMRGVVSASMQGVNVTLDDQRDASSGLPDVTRFIDLYAADGARPSGVWAPDANHGWELVEVTAAPSWS